jgi:integration host factor subunit alpha
MIALEDDHTPGVSRREALDIVIAFFQEIAAGLEAEGVVKLAGFGAFRLRIKDSRPGRNPRTGERVPISSRRVVLFRPANGLKGRVRKARPDRRGEVSRAFGSMGQQAEARPAR